MNCIQAVSIMTGRIKNAWQRARAGLQRFFKEQHNRSGFVADTNLSNLSKPATTSHVLLAVAVVLFVVMVITAKFITLDEVTSGDGKVIPSSQIQLIQNLEGGIVRKLNVKEGQIVERGQILMQIDDTRFKANLKEARSKEISMKIKIERLKAEISNKPLKLSAAIQKTYPKEVRDAKLLYKARKVEYQQLRDRYITAKRELALSIPLLKKGATSRAEILQQKKLAADLNADVLDFKATSLKDLISTKSEYAAIEKANTAHLDRFTRTTVKSPVRGIIKVINTNTIGGVIQPGDTVMEIVPLDDTLLVEAKIRPADIGFLHPKQRAVVKISAYEYGVYGGLDGIVETISADTIKDDEDKPFYIIRVRTHKNFLEAKGKKLNIIPGMHATVDIHTGEKSLFDYLLKPIMKTRKGAVEE